MLPRRKLRQVVVLLSLMLAGVTVAEDVSAIIGRPLTPMSYAGVARRTARRNAYYY